MYRYYIVSADTDKGVKTLKVCTTKSVQDSKFKKEIRENIKEYYNVDGVVILDIVEERFLSLINV